jgi:hypothetical protein
LELPSRPQIIVVEEGHPLAVARRDAGVAGCTHALRAVLSDHANPRVLEHAQPTRGPWIEAVVHYDDLEIDLVLVERAADGKREEPGAPARWDNHRQQRHDAPAMTGSSVR